MSHIQSFKGTSVEWDLLSLQCFGTVSLVSGVLLACKNLATAICKGSSLEGLCRTWSNLEWSLEKMLVKQKLKAVEWNVFWSMGRILAGSPSCQHQWCSNYQPHYKCWHNSSRLSTHVVWSLDPETRMWPNGCQDKLQTIVSWASSILPSSFSLLTHSVTRLSSKSLLLCITEHK